MGRRRSTAHSAFCLQPYRTEALHSTDPLFVGSSRRCTILSGCRAQGHCGRIARPTRPVELSAAAFRAASGRRVPRLSQRDRARCARRSRHDIIVDHVSSRREAAPPSGSARSTVNTAQTQALISRPLNQDTRLKNRTPQSSEVVQGRPAHPHARFNRRAGPPCRRTDDR